MAPVYGWKEHTYLGVAAQVAGERVEALRRERGGWISPHDLVEDARPADAPLHPAFEWDDAKAAERYRVEQARTLLQRLVVVRDDGEQVQAVVSLHRARDDWGWTHREASYTGFDVIAADPDLTDELLEQARADIDAFVARYEQFRALLGVARQARGISRELSRMSGARVQPPA